MSNKRIGLVRSISMGVLSVKTIGLKEMGLPELTFEKQLSEPNSRYRGLDKVEPFYRLANEVLDELVSKTEKWPIEAMDNCMVDTSDSCSHKSSVFIVKESEDLCKVCLNPNDITVYFQQYGI